MGGISGNEYVECKDDYIRYCQGRLESMLKLLADFDDPVVLQ